VQLKALLTVGQGRSTTLGVPLILAALEAVVRLGEQLSVEVPVHRMIYAALLPLERRARREVKWTTWDLGRRARPAVTGYGDVPGSTSVERWT
jgi:hypothetical protein